MFGGIVKPICFAAFRLKNTKCLIIMSEPFVAFVILVVSHCLRV
jgi:hypothetical protein